MLLQGTSEITVDGKQALLQKLSQWESLYKGTGTMAENAIERCTALLNSNTLVGFFSLYCVGLDLSAFLGGFQTHSNPSRLSSRVPLSNAAFRTVHAADKTADLTSCNVRGLYIFASFPDLILSAPPDSDFFACLSLFFGFQVQNFRICESGLLNALRNLP
jgi:hypothetical protein